MVPGPAWVQRLTLRCICPFVTAIQPRAYPLSLLVGGSYVQAGEHGSDYSKSHSFKPFETKPFCWCDLVGGC